MAYGKKQSGEKKNIEGRELKVYAKSENKGGETRLRIVAWVIDGKVLDPMFEKRAFVLRGEGNLQMSKAKGMSSADLIFMFNHKDEILADMQSFTQNKHDEEVKTAQNKDFDFAEEEKVADEMFS